MYDPEDEEEEGKPGFHEDEEDEDYYGDDDMGKRHSGHSEESYRSGRFLGVDFPYVPGDPFW